MQVDPKAIELIRASKVNGDVLATTFEQLSALALLAPDVLPGGAVHFTIRWQPEEPTPGAYVPTLTFTLEPPVTVIIPE
jgi:hypothetical protein